MVGLRRRRALPISHAVVCASISLPVDGARHQNHVPSSSRTMDEYTMSNFAGLVQHPADISYQRRSTNYRILNLISRLLSTRKALCSLQAKRAWRMIGAG